MNVSSHKQLPKQTGCFYKLTLLWIALGFYSSAAGQHVLDSKISGNAGNGTPGNCFAQCPCELSGNTSCAGDPLPHYIPGHGDVIGVACSDFGVLRARAWVDNTNEIAFGATARFYDFVTLQGATSSVIVRVTFQMTGTASGVKYVSSGLRVWNNAPPSVVNPSLNLTRIVQDEIGVGVQFDLEATLQLNAGDCHGITDGDADYYTGNNGLRITRFEVFSTNGISLPNVSAVGTSGTVYRGCPNIIQQPVSTNQCTGAAATLIVGLGPLPSWDLPAYQWFKDEVMLTGQTNAALTIVGAQPSQSGDYWVRISNDCGTVNSQRASLTVQPPPTVIEPPRDRTTCPGDTVEFSVIVSTNSPVTYQWRRGATILPGETNFTLTLTSVSANDVAAYSVLISDGVCQTLATQNAQLDLLTPAEIVTQPAPIGVCGSGAFSLSVTASGSPPISYQWRSNGIPISGANSSNYAGFFSGAAPQTFDVIVANNCTNVTSASASVRRVTPIELFPGEPANQDVCQGDQFVFGLILFVFQPDTNARPLTYQWRKNGVDIPGAMSFFYGKSHASTNDVGVYSCVVSNACGEVFSSNATLTVRPVSVSVGASSPTPTEGGVVPGVFTITRNQGQCGDLRVFYSVSGSATNGIHYTLLDGSVTIPAGVASSNVTIRTIDDLLALGDKTVVLTLMANTNYQLAATGQTASVTIHDNDALGLVVSSTLVRVPEGGVARFGVALNGPPVNASGAGMQVTFARNGGDPDLQRSGSTQFRIREGNWNDPQFFSISASADADSTNGTATFTVSAGGLSNVIVTAVEIDQTGPPEIASIVCLTNGIKELRILGYPGSNYVVEATSRLDQTPATILWRSVGTSVADANGLARFTVQDAQSSTQEFFRARRP